MTFEPYRYRLLLHSNPQLMDKSHQQVMPLDVFRAFRSISQIDDPNIHLAREESAGAPRREFLDGPYNKF